MGLLNKNLRDILKTHGEPKAKKINPPLFITGCMRSGTTFLANKLATHPQLLKVGAELNQVWTDIGGADIRGACPHLTDADASAAVTYQMSNYFFDYIQESKSWKRHLMRWLKKRDTNLFRVKYDWEELIPINKSPHLINKIGYVHALFPESKFIFIIRDIYGHSSSLKYHFLKTGENGSVSKDNFNCWHISKGLENSATGESFPGNFSLIPEMWVRLNLIGLREIQLLDKSQYLVVDYDDLISNQSLVFARIFEFIGTSQRHRNIEEKIKLIQAKKKNTSTKGSSKDKWKAQLTDDEKNQVAAVLSKEDDQYKEIIETLDRLKIKV